MKQNLVTQRIAQHKKNRAGGLVSICSACPEVIAAAADIVRDYNEILLIESTSNQVDQFGGYTGKTPIQFINETQEIVAQSGFPADKLVFGGDHLGPNSWQREPAEQAMEKACELVRQYASSGYDKIHLDCSMSCADDPVPLDDYTVAKRAARLCKIAEEARSAHPDMPPIAYIIGTEVPVPGGAQESIHAGITPTTPDAARKTYAIHHQIFAEYGLEEVWSRIVALVVQPGVEFDHHQVVDYQPERARALSAIVEDWPYAVFEAHSTDYQTAHAFQALVRDHFAILKVGPALTFAYREALFAINDAIQAYHGSRAVVDIRTVAENIMCEHPEKWQQYYHGTSEEQKILRMYSLSDRIRYYWHNAHLQTAISQLCTQFDAEPLPFGMMHQYLADAVEACHTKRQPLSSELLIRHHIRSAIRPYLDAITQPIR